MPVENARAHEYAQDKSDALTGEIIRKHHGVLCHAKYLKLHELSAQLLMGCNVL